MILSSFPTSLIPASVVDRIRTLPMKCVVHELTRVRRSICTLERCLPEFDTIPQLTIVTRPISQNLLSTAMRDVIVKLAVIHIGYSTFIRPQDTIAVGQEPVQLTHIDITVPMTHDTPTVCHAAANSSPSSSLTDEARPETPARRAASQWRSSDNGPAYGARSACTADNPASRSSNQIPFCTQSRSTTQPADTTSNCTEQVIAIFHSEAKSRAQHRTSLSATAKVPCHSRNCRTPRSCCPRLFAIADAKLFTALAGHGMR
eukprot:CAMPEP_0204446330 /NCGR_PEP_ID=MMETSP0470-20130426/94516_1 /ASSEMBLY_ACC=CAM_ASM_000385 /TAXON_ID=2969 /ORGANISM="Oxyrrhis marina" /LENGTH=259 /DNA_ID=CAMNT_0051445897 /DNA_START=39 /DNA_END=819 /DNA_ORIENTATION=-